VKYLATLYAGLRALMIAALAGSPASAQAPVGTDRETAEWNAARGACTVEAFQHYLELYPLGRYSGEAFRSIIELTVDPDAAVACPEAGPEGGPSVSTRGLAVDMY
jgi:hypothetical protein